MAISKRNAYGVAEFVALLATHSAARSEVLSRRPPGRAACARARSHRGGRSQRPSAERGHRDRPGETSRRHPINLPARVLPCDGQAKSGLTMLMSRTSPRALQPSNSARAGPARRVRGGGIPMSIPFTATCPSESRREVPSESRRDEPEHNGDKSHHRHERDPVHLTAPVAKHQNPLPLLHTRPRGSSCSAVSRRPALLPCLAPPLHRRPQPRLAGRVVPPSPHSAVPPPRSRAAHGPAVSSTALGGPTAMVTRGSGARRSRRAVLRRRIAARSRGSRCGPISEAFFTATQLNVGWIEIGMPQPNVRRPHQFFCKVRKFAQTRSFILWRWPRSGSGRPVPPVINAAEKVVSAQMRPIWGGQRYHRRTRSHSRLALDRRIRAEPHSRGAVWGPSGRPVRERALAAPAAR